MTLHDLALTIQHTISFLGMFIILAGVLVALFEFIKFLLKGKGNTKSVNQIRLDLGRILILGLEFIVAADLIGTTTAPDYYSIGIVACIVAIRTLLSFTLNKEISALSKETA